VYQGSISRNTSGIRSESKRSKRRTSSFIEHPKRASLDDDGGVIVSLGDELLERGPGVARS
jgi:hypothetical protein